MKRVLIIGGAGYVGKFVVKSFLKAGIFDIDVLSHSNGSFLLQDLPVNVLTSETLKNNNEYDIIINLAYPSGVTPLKYKSINKEIIGSIKQNLKSEGKVIHTSSLAVFGYPLDYNIVTKQIKKRYDLPYVMTKIEMENLLQSEFKNKELHIVRLGNVWGPASPFWTFTLTDKLFFGEPIMVKNKDGYSNITDVSNVADYLLFLAKNEYSNKVAFHHLAEFSNIKWSEIIEKLSGFLNEKIIYLNSFAITNNSLRREIIENLNAIIKIPSKTKLLNTRYLSGFLWNTLSFLPNSIIKLLKNLIKNKNMNETNSIEEIDTNFFTLITCEKQFNSVVDKNWKPFISFDESIKNVELWLKNVGY